MKKQNITSLYHILVPANIFRIACIDERQIAEKNETNPVNLPGATYGLIDSLKTLYHYSEEDAWKIVHRVNIPVCSHVDDHFGTHEVIGCGYAMLVETCPQSVLAPEKVKAVERLLTVKELGGEILHYQGEHKANFCVINYKQGFSVNQDQLPELGIFSCDVWAAKYYSQILKQIDPQINPNDVANQIEKVFLYTVKALTHEKKIQVIRLK